MLSIELRLDESGIASVDPRFHNHHREMNRSPKLTSQIL
jgi:hypothetical protein